MNSPSRPAGSDCIGKIHLPFFDRKIPAADREIDRRGPAVNSVIELNPDALAIADASTRSGRPKSARPAARNSRADQGQYYTADRMQTTAGSLALRIASGEGFVRGAEICARRARSFWAD